jgi:LacI family transcriptional regulator
LNQREIAKLAGVSSATVSRVINSEPGVAPKTAEQVSKIISQYGYVQNVIARNLKMAKTKTIGFLIPNILNPFFPAVLSGIETVSVKYEYNMIVQNTNNSTLREEASVETLLKHRVDGLLAVLVNHSGTQLSKFQSMGIPVVLIDRLTIAAEYDSVTVDNIGGVTQGIEYLARLGHTKIAVIHGTQTTSPGEERLRGYFNVMRDIGLEVVKEYVVDGNFSEEGGYLSAQQLMQLSDPPTAIFALNNFSTMGAYKALADARIKIPQEVSLLGFDDFSLAGYLAPPITVINRPMFKMGHIATEMLFERLLGEPDRPAQKVVLPTALKIRCSCSHP